MAQMHTLDVLLRTLLAPAAPDWSHIAFETAADEPDLVDDDDDEDEDDDEDDDDDEDEDGEGKDEDTDADEEVDDLDEDEESDEEDEDEAEARTARGQLKRQNGHRWGGHTNG